MFAGWQLAAVSLASLGLTVILTPLMRALAQKLSVMDSPDGERKMQTHPIPYLGGIAISIATSSTLIVASILDGSSSQNLPLLIGVLIPAIALAGIGLLDDLRGLTPLPRFLMQSLAGALTAGALTLTGSGVRISEFAALDIGLTVFWVIGVTNALNLLDNTDGVATGTAAIAAGALALIAFLNGQYLVSALSLVLAASCSGFLVWNRFPATIYMGDSGSLFIGFMLAAAAIRIDLESVPRGIAISVPILVLLVPIFDTTLVVSSRLRRGVSPFIGGLDHAAHRIRRMGLSVPGTAAVLWAGSAVAGGISVLVSQVAISIAAALVGLCAVAFVVGLWLALRLPDSGDLP